MKFGLFYLFSDFGNVAQDRLLREVLEEITYAEELHLLGSLVPGAPALPSPTSYEAYPEASRRLSAVGEDEVRERGSCFGSPERVAGMLKRYLHRTGTNHIALEMRIGGLEHTKVMRSMRLFAREVMPEVRAAAHERASAAR